jgi:hypothetical protein
MLTETSLAADWRAHVSYCRDAGIEVDREISFAVSIADLFEIPDDMPLIPAVCAAMETPTRLDDPESMARTRQVALAAGREMLDCTSVVTLYNNRR